MWTVTGVFAERTPFKYGPQVPYQGSAAVDLPVTEILFLNGYGVGKCRDVDAGAADDLPVHESSRRLGAALNISKICEAGGGGEGTEEGEGGAAEGGERPGREFCQAEDPHPDCKS